MTLDQVIAGWTKSFPEHNWIRTVCPACNTPSLIRLGRTRIAIGTVDGAPGPCFISKGSMPATGLKVIVGDETITLRWAGGSKTI